MLLIPKLGRGCGVNLTCFLSLLVCKLLVVIRDWQEEWERFLNLSSPLHIYSLLHSAPSPFWTDEDKDRNTRPNSWGSSAEEEIFLQVSEYWNRENTSCRWDSTLFEAASRVLKKWEEQGGKCGGEKSAPGGMRLGQGCGCTTARDGTGDIWKASRRTWEKGKCSLLLLKHLVPPFNGHRCSAPSNSLWKWIRK